MCIKNYYIIIFYREFRNLISCKIMRINERFAIVDTCFYYENILYEKYYYEKFLYLSRLWRKKKWQENISSN